MSELLNQRSSLQGKIPSGDLNSLFDFSGSWLQDATETTHLAFDGYFISLYHLHLTRTPLVLKEDVKSVVPSNWDPAALDRFIETFGTHIIVAVAIGGQDVVFAMQSHSSCISPAELKNHLKNLGDQLFSDGHSLSPFRNNKRENRQKGLTIFCSKRGGIIDLRNHSDWLRTVPEHPDEILFSLVPITSLLTGVVGSGFLSHAINLYLRYKPSIDEFQYFLEFQVPRQWAPVYNELPLGPSTKRISVLHYSSALWAPNFMFAQFRWLISLYTGLCG